jgi:hypothetical protein
MIKKLAIVAFVTYLLVGVPVLYMCYQKKLTPQKTHDELADSFYMSKTSPQRDSFFRQEIKLHITDLEKKIKARDSGAQIRRNIKFNH